MSVSPRRRAGWLAVMAAVPILAACVPAADAPAAQRGLMGGLLAWITGADERRAAALEAAAERAEATVRAARHDAEAPARAGAAPP
jgi:hypothetical protein